MADRILVVDDEEINRELLEGILAPDGYRIAFSADGTSALHAVRASRPDLVLLDLLMPGMSGLEVCRRLKDDPDVSDIPIIVVTALGQVAAKEAALTRGADDFVTKPVQADDLRARVAAMLKVRRLRSDLDRTLAYLHELEVSRQARRRETLQQLLPGMPGAGGDGRTAIPILLVDDETLSREFYRDLLTEHGFQVVTAAAGQEALERLARQAFDALVLDVVMPGMSGLQVLGRVRESQPDLPVIMLTAQVGSGSALAAVKLGAFDFLVKGLDHSLVVLAVHRAVRHRREALARRQEIDELRARLAGA
jgi:CheY-like chemotaxis protein